MDIVSIIVQVREDVRNALARVFENMPHISIYGMKDNQIVLMLDTDDIHVLAHNIREIQKMDGVIVVHPVFSRDSLPF